MKAIIIGFERGIRRLSSEDSYPAALEKISSTTKTTLDWIINELDTIKVSEIIFIGGYHIEKVITSYPNLKYYYNNNWASDNLLDVLSNAKDELDQDLLIVSTNTIFRTSLVKDFINSKADITSANTEDSNNLNTSILFFNKKTSKSIKELLSKENTFDSFDQVLKVLTQNENISLEIFKNHQGLCRVESSSSLAKFMLGTKAQTLDRIQPMLRTCRILDQIKITCEKWENNHQEMLDSVSKKFPDQSLVVRSSSVHEDAWENSNAGRFDSFLDIPSSNIRLLDKNINKVFESFIRENLYDKTNEVLIQPYISNSKISGVVFTVDIESGAPYYVINYDDTSSLTDTVTSGYSEDIKTLYIYKNRANNHPNELLRKLMQSVSEVEKILSYSQLDIEFAITDDSQVYLLQVRPLNVSNANAGLLQKDFHNEILSIQNFLNQKISKRDNFYGSSTVFGDMPDWNPAEMIGTSPKPLALSLYQELITDHSWALARKKMGYIDVTSKKLMIALTGKPFIDVRRSFNSFLVPEIPKYIAEKLVDNEIRFLKENPEKHDKVEFEVVVNCHNMNSTWILEHLQNNIQLDQKESKIVLDAYLEWTNNLIQNASELYKDLNQQYEMLNSKREQATYEDNLSSMSSAINTLIFDCKKYGVVPFSIHARTGFVAMSILKSMLIKGCINQDEYDLILNNIPTMSTEFQSDLKLLHNNLIEKNEFILKYGHLRPSSYDITALNYSNLMDLGVFEKNTTNIASKEVADIVIAKKVWQSNNKAIENLIKEEGMDFGCSQLFDFIVGGIQGREKGKFEFTKNLNMILNVVKDIASIIDISIEDAAFLPIRKFLTYEFQTRDSVENKEVKTEINKAKKRFVITNSVKLKSLITSIDDIYFINFEKMIPNYITNKQVDGEIIFLDSRSKNFDIKNKIVLIVSADPGYDWIFSSQIKGLITMYGGAASHMAIRAAENSIPSAIGCGEDLFNSIKRMPRVFLDCQQKMIKEVH